MRYVLLIFLSFSLLGGDLKLKALFKKKTFERPIALLEAGDNAWYVLEQRGKIWFCQEGKNKSLVADISERLGTANEEGLLSMVKSPSFESDHHVYIYYSYKHPRRSIVARFNLQNYKIDLDSEVKLLSIAEPYGNHNGGQLAFGPDKKLYVGVGDGGSAGDPKGYGQNLENLHGSILRIDVLGQDDYSVPRDNPFVDSDLDAKKEIFAWGLRNPWRFSFDKKTQEIWCGDVGQNKFEEVNIINAGSNYGWNVREGYEPYVYVKKNKKKSSKKNKSLQRKPSNPGMEDGGFTDPIFVYPRKEGLSITGGYVYRGQAIKKMYGWYVMSDFASGAYWLLKKESDKIVESHRIKGKSLQIASFAEDSGGELYMMSFKDGTIYQIMDWIQ
ncbi:PQQ-dependent sugar dehydrogenase [Lentisphaera profundi]|uniref:PQQ-dependent sugar dehydrogenase n=1 Tax=Lentisphaera profundi TaxID=1658616 RepID=A0ABY7VWH7_9BACT|nr:PQQ-dependent sugar dehydrogenase [Lentisphaera profundi]WDE98134.1 PQQ-dependent sugar dehydrogenase [Lentisphaera profundi]